jgi:iron complex outermembrane recepter protein
MAMHRRCGTVVWIAVVALVIAVALGHGVTARAQEQPTNQPAQATTDQQGQGSLTPAGYTEIVISAPRMDVPYKEAPGATTVVGQEVLQEAPRAISAAETLKLVPGVNVDDQLNSEKVHLSIRGIGILSEYGIRGIQVLLDGIPLNDPSGFAPDLYDVDWDNVERVEVIRGPSGAFYGGGSSGGVINIITKSGRDDGAASGLALEGGSYAFVKGIGEVAGSTKTTDWRLFASRGAADNYREHSAFNSTNLSGKLRWAPSADFQLNAMVLGTSYFQENPEGLPWDVASTDPQAANPDSDKFNEFQQTRRLTAAVSGTWATTKNQDLSFSLYGRWYTYQEAFPSAVQKNDISNPGATLQYAFHLGSGTVKNHLIFGADGAWQSIDQTKHPNMGGAIEGPELLADQTVNQDGVGLYAMDRIEFGPKWSAFLNVRYDDIHNKLTDHLKLGGVSLSGSRTFSKTTGRVGVQWNPTPDVGLYATWGQGFLPPNTQELIANPVTQGGFNQLITPATSTGEELGARGRVGDVFVYDVAGFYLTTSNDFERYRVTSRPLETFYRNAGDSRRYGLETAFGWFPVKGLAIRGTYTYNNFTYTDYYTYIQQADYSGNYMPNSPKNQGYLDVAYTTDSGWTFDASGKFMSMWYVDASNVPTAPGYNLMNLQARYRHDFGTVRAEFQFSVQNLFDKHYIAFTEPDPDGNSYQPAAGRQIFFGVHLWFK